MKNYLIIPALFILLISCKEEKDPSGQIKIDSVMYITHSSAIVCITETHDPVTSSFGVTYAMFENQLDSSSIEACGNGINKIGLKNLKPNTEYFVKAWITVTNSKNGSIIKNYSKVHKIKTQSVDYFIDNRDSRKYPVVKINDDIWTAENLYYKGIEGFTEYNGNINNEQRFGMLYPISKIKDVIPDGWRIPTFDDIQKLLQEANKNREKTYSLIAPRYCLYDEIVSNKSGFDILFTPRPTNDGFTSDSWAEFFIDSASDIKIFSIDRDAYVRIYQPTPNNVSNIRLVKNVN
mgnify:CR=1 FL=1